MARQRLRASAADRLERLDGDFHERVRHGFVALARADETHWAVVDGMPRSARWRSRSPGWWPSGLGGPSVTGPGADDPRPVPALFAEVVGQPAAVAALRAAARHPVHAYLLVGRPGRGAGRRPGRSRPPSCVRSAAAGECDTCRRALAGTHPDLVVVERTGACAGRGRAPAPWWVWPSAAARGDRQVLVVTDVHLADRVGARRS